MQRSLCSIGAVLRSAAFVGLALLAVSICSGAAWAAEDQFQISVVSWKAEKSMLKVEGVAQKPDSLVMVRDADTKALLGCAAVRADGKWKLKLRNPKKVPTRMLVECDEGVRECQVAQAPTSAK